MKKIASFLLILSSLLIFYSCSKESDTTNYKKKIIGTWKVINYKSGRGNIYAGINGYECSGNLCIQFNTNGTVITSGSATYGNEYIQNTLTFDQYNKWEIYNEFADDCTISLTYPSGSTEYFLSFINDNTITMDALGIGTSYRLTRVN